MWLGRYGFVKLQYYSKERGFENDFTFTNSRDLFDALWQEWRDTKLIQRAMETSMQGMDYNLYHRYNDNRRKLCYSWLQKEDKRRQRTPQKGKRHDNNVSF